MTVEGELDDISGSGQTRAAQDMCSGVPAGERQHLEVVGAGHYGIFSGRRWRDIVYPQVVKFIQGHAPKAKVAAPKPSVAVSTQPVAETKTTSAPAPVAAPVAASPAAKPASQASAKTPAKASAKTAVKASTQSAVKANVTKAAVKTAAAPAAKPAPKAAAPVKDAAKAPVKAAAKAPFKSNKAAAKPQGTVKTAWVAPKA
jgi:poly(3-hydroxybutyrate) depolymerase